MKRWWGVGHLWLAIRAPPQPLSLRQPGVRARLSRSQRARMRSWVARRGAELWTMAALTMRLGQPQLPQPIDLVRHGRHESHGRRAAARYRNGFQPNSHLRLLRAFQFGFHVRGLRVFQDRANLLQAFIFQRITWRTIE